jgi:hypothetical protein
LAPGQRGKKKNHGKESVQKTEVTTGRREAHVHARKRAQRKVTTGGGEARVWEKELM